MGWRGHVPGLLGSLLFLILAPVPRHPTARAEGLRDFGDGWLLSAPDRALVLETTDRPSLGDSRGIWWLGAGQGRLFSLPDLPLSSLECGWRRKSGRWPLSLALEWERLGADLFLEDTRTVKLGVGAGIRLGIRVRARSWSVEKEPIASAWELAIQGGLDFRLGSGCPGKLAFWLHALDPPAWHGGGSRRALAGLRLFPPGAGVALQVDQKGDGAPVLSLEILGRLSHRVGLGWRVDPDTGSLGGTFTARLGGLWWQTSHLVHPALGVTHRFQLGCGDAGAAPW